MDNKSLLKKGKSADGTVPDSVHRQANEFPKSLRWALRGLIVTVAAVLLVVIYRFADRQHLTILVHWVEAHRRRGAALLIAVHITCTVCLVPTAVLAVAAGALFGFTRGMVLIWIASIFGEVMAFTLGRYLFRAYIERISAAWPMWIAMEDALKQDGWKLVMLLRICPASPFVVLNYALGSTSLPFSHYFWPSVFGIAPGIALYVWGGALVKDLSDVAHADGALANATPPQARIAFGIISGVTVILVLFGTAWYTKRALARRLARAGSGAYDNDPETGQSGGQGTDLRGVLHRIKEARPGMAQRTSGGGRARYLPPPCGPPSPSPPPQQLPGQPQLQPTQQQQQRLQQDPQQLQAHQRQH